ncbi:MAG: hypothetical protein V2I97_00655 [Desulfococcaceae bacterium]|jgi:serine/threonine protein kinase|nr:hypothetical protein [Desulfococcaceae bacterium]
MKKTDIQKTGSPEKTENLKAQVLNFFLNLFSVQSGIPDQADTERHIVCLDSDSAGPDYSYELRIRGSECKSRRMTLGLLGEDSGSKSICFKVIYDDLLVVKIPPEPIRDFTEYLESIRGERQIAERLAPHIECIVPSVSAILKKIPEFAAPSDAEGDSLEKHYISSLKKNTSCQTYLKIGDRFAFFMALSRNDFLGHVIEKMHNVKNKICENIFSQPDILWNMEAFEGLFGSIHSPVFFYINEIYADYEEKVNLLMKKNGLNASAFTYKRKEWFLLWLAEKDIAAGVSGTDRDFIPALRELFAELQENRWKEIEDYREMMRSYISEKTFEQNRPHFKGLISGILHLLSRLRQKGIAIRDLKPDNIFLVGNAHLHYREEMPLGLIDFETAADFGVPVPAQPFRGGTPSYATPSHLADNPLLLNTLRSLPRIFQLQDWYAAVAMIYYALRGEVLFSQTRIWFAESGKILQEAGEDSKTREQAFIRCSRFFWYSACCEFRRKTAAAAAFFSSLQIQLSEDVREMFIRELRTEQQENSRKTEKHIHGQSFFKSGKSRRDLIRSDYETVRRCRKNWESGVNVPQIRPEIRSDIICLFRNLETLKREYAKQKQMIVSLQRSPLLAASDLLTMMFHIVFHGMYKAEWGDPEDRQLPEEMAMRIGRTNTSADEAEKNSYEETVSYESAAAPEETVSYDRTVSYDQGRMQEETL